MFNSMSNESLLYWISVYTDAARFHLTQARRYRKRGMPLTAQLEEQDARIRKAYVMWLKHRLT